MSSVGLVDLTGDDDNDDNDEHVTNASIDISDDDDDDDAEEVLVSTLNHKRKRNEDSNTNVNTNAVQSNQQPTSLVVNSTTLMRFERVVGRSHPLFRSSYRVAEDEALKSNRHILVVELPPIPDVLSCPWYSLLRSANLIQVANNEFVPILAVNPLKRCIVIDPRSGNIREVNATKCYTAVNLIAAMRGAGGAMVSARKRAHSASVDVEVTEVSRDAANRDLKAAQENAYHSALAIDQMRDQLRARLAARRARAIERRDLRMKLVIAQPSLCDVRVRLPNGTTIQSVFDLQVDIVLALLDCIVIEATLQLGESFDIANYQLCLTFPKRCVAAETVNGDSDAGAMASLTDTLATAGFDRRMMLVLEDR